MDKRYKNIIYIIQIYIRDVKYKFNYDLIFIKDKVNIIDNI